jgi:hypothetical protein
MMAMNSHNTATTAVGINIWNVMPISMLTYNLTVFAHDHIGLTAACISLDDVTAQP